MAPVTAMSRKAVVTSLNPRQRHENCSLCKPGLAPRYSSASGARLPHDGFAGTGAKGATHLQAKSLQRDVRSLQQGLETLHCAAQMAKLSAGPLRASYDFCVSSGHYSGHVLSCPKREKGSKARQWAFSARADALLFMHAGLSGPESVRLTVAGCKLAAGTETSISRFAAC